MKIAIVGGSGFVGSRLIDLLKTKHELINIDKRQSPFFSKITYIANVLDLSAMVKAFSNNIDAVVLLAAEHRDDVTPTSLYYDVNVQGARNVIEAMVKNGVQRLIFTSSVAVYGLNKPNPDEDHMHDPFNHYGKSKWQAEEVLRQWYDADRSLRYLSIVRPTVIFGERNRGNVYNLLKQIAGKAFMIIGKGENKKSMAYVGNVVAFIDFLLGSEGANYSLYNYVDTPDQTMNTLVAQVGSALKRKIPSRHVPYVIGLLGGYGFDVLSVLFRKKLAISSIRVKKFCATTQFNADRAHRSGFQRPYSLAEGLTRTIEYEFVHPQADQITFISE